MSAEVRPEEPLTPEPGPIRGKKFTTTTLMVGLIILVAGAAAIALGKVANTALSLRRTEKVRADLYAWKAQLAKDNPSIVFAVVVEGSTVDLLGTSLHHNGKYTTPTGRPVLIDLEYRRDWSNQPFFLSSSLGRLEMSQPTIGFGAIWWFGQKQGAW